MFEETRGSAVHATCVRGHVSRTRALARMSITGVGVLCWSLLSAIPGEAIGLHSNTTVCELQAVVTIDPPGLTTTTSTFTYSIFGQLIPSVGPPPNACASTDPSAPTGTSSWDAGNAAIVRVQGTDASGPWSVDYALPQSTGTGSCAESTSYGTVLVQWPDGTATVIDYTTIGVGSAWLLGGTVVQKARLHEVASSGTPPAGTPTTYTASSSNSSFPAGTSFGGQVAFINELSDPTCAGTTSAGFTGAVEMDTP
jgi:hypothetical protein